MKKYFLIPIIVITFVSTINQKQLSGGFKKLSHMNTILEETNGYKLAIAFKPFIDPKCTEHMEIVKDMAKSINSVINNKRITTRIEVGTPADKIMEAAIASREIEGVKSESNGGFVTFTFENISGLQMFKLGQSYSYLANL